LILAGLFTDPSLDPHDHKGAFYTNGKQFGVQLLGTIMVLVWSAVITYLITWFIHLTVSILLHKLVSRFNFCIQVRSQKGNVLNLARTISNREKSEEFCKSNWLLASVRADLK